MSAVTLRQCVQVRSTQKLHVDTNVDVFACRPFAEQILKTDIKIYYRRRVVLEKNLSEKQDISVDFA